MFLLFNISIYYNTYIHFPNLPYTENNDTAFFKVIGYKKLILATFK